jgi:hypothetical protein
VVGHNDAAPYNTVLGPDGPVGFIDWDVAGPARPRWDLAFVAWSWLPLHHPELGRELGGPGESTQAGRLRLLCAAYGDTDPAGLLPLVADRVAVSRDGVRDGAELGDPVMVRLRDGGHLDAMDRTLRYLDARLPELARELTAGPAG